MREYGSSNPHVVAYEQKYGDCGGGWQVYMRQSMPGHGTHATNNDGTANQDVSRILISTTVDGAVFDGADTKNGSAADQFLNATTPETDRVFVEDSVATATINYDAGNQNAAPGATSENENSPSAGPRRR